MTPPIDRMDPPPPPSAAPPTAASASLRGPAMLRVGVVLGAALVLLVSAALTFGASPTPTGPPGAAPQTPPSGNGGNGPRLHDRGFGGLFGHGGGARFGFGNITVTAIDGSNLALKTDDGWTRTIAVTSTTKLTKGGNAIGLGDVKVGDRIRFHQTRKADGTFSIDAVEVVLPGVVGKVTAKTADSITVETLGGGTVTVHVSASTTYRVAGKDNAGLADVAVGAIIGAQGEKRADGSLDATSVRAASKPGKWFGGRGGNQKPNAGPHASPNESPGSTTG